MRTLEMGGVSWSMKKGENDMLRNCWQDVKRWALGLHIPTPPLYVSGPSPFLGEHMSPVFELTVFFAADKLVMFKNHHIMYNVHV